MTKEKEKGAVISTATCRECGAVMEGRKNQYKYVESGLNSVTLKDILVFHCTGCNDIVPEIPAAGVLHRVIAMRLLMKRTLLTGSEVRFLRKLCGYSINDFADLFGSSKNVVSRWENQSNHGKGTDRAVRLLVVAKMVRELTGQPEPVLKNINPQELLAQVEEGLKLIEARHTNEKYEIPPAELARFGARQSPELAMEHIH